MTCTVIWRAAWIALVTLMPGDALAAPGPVHAPVGDTATEARNLRKTGRLPDAIALLTGARRENSTDPELAGLLGLCLLDAGRLPDADALAAKTRETAGEAYVLTLFRGRLALVQGDTVLAIGLLEAAAAASSHKPVEALVNLVRAHAAEQNFVRGAVTAERLEAWNEPLGKRLGAQMLEAAGDRILQRAGRNMEALPRALEKFEAALSRDPENDALALKVYDTLIRNHRSTQALALLDRLFPADGDAAERSYQLGRCLTIAGDMEGAEHALRDTLAATPQRTDAAVELARILVGRSDTDEAVKLLTPHATRKVYDADVQLLLGMAHERAGRFTEAEIHLRRARELSPRQPESMYHLGRVLMRLGKTDEGRALLREFKTTSG